ncbi:unnamed protein product [Calicophoron daubneyi]|uniref:V-type proton ATPase proteolipid subunit n=1 Tax=Calicophoron daubneyi TaxID=300641 RepID=A0AAV2THL0_CALDB
MSVMSADTLPMYSLLSAIESGGEPIYTPFFGLMGSAIAVILCAIGGGYGTARAGMSIACVGISYPHVVMKSLVPIVMAGIVAIYGLVVSVLIAQKVDDDYSLRRSLFDFGAGLSVGISGLAAGYAIGVVGEAGVRASAKQPRMFVGMVLILIFAEVLGLYGLIVALIMATK